MIPQDWHGHRSSYYHISSGIYSKNQNSALNQLIDWAYNLFFLTVGLYTILADLFWNNLPDKIKDLISSILIPKDPERSRHAIKKKR